MFDILQNYGSVCKGNCLLKTMLLKIFGEALKRKKSRQNRPSWKCSEETRVLFIFNSYSSNSIQNIINETLCKTPTFQLICWWGNFVHSHKIQKDSLETRAELAILRTYGEKKAILELILLYRASKCKQAKEQGSEDCLWTRSFTFL